jgi:glutamate 5-kinase
MAGVRRLVVKVGSSLIAHRNTGVSRERIRALADAVTTLPPPAREVIIVTSGAIAAGRSVCGGMERPTTIPQKQALAAIGQGRLMGTYDEVFLAAGRKVAQILLTLEDFRDRRRFLNARNTIFTLLSWGVIPVVNENDTVAVDEIKFGDNDTLSALVTSLAEADLLIILSDVEGLFDGNPADHPEARLIATVRRVDESVLEVAGGTSSGVGTGGMATKVKAALKVMDLGLPTVIASGHRPDALPRILAGEEEGTLFLPRPVPMNRRKHWIRHTLRPRGSLTLDRGAVRAITGQGRSLLAAGISAVEGNFRAGDAVRCLDQEGREFARGLVNYSAREVDLIRGRHTDEIEGVLGYKDYDEVVHRDDLVLLERPGHPRSGPT